MYLVDNYGFPLERMKGRPIFNLIRLITSLLIGKIRLRRGKYKEYEFVEFSYRNEPATDEAWLK